jgi:hypothetical protein
MLAACAAKPVGSEVAVALMHDPEGRPMRGVFNAALASRFPVGSSLEALSGFIVSLGGACSRNVDGIHYRCWLDIEPCFNRINAAVQAEGDVITKVEVLEFGLITCN